MATIQKNIRFSDTMQIVSASLMEVTGDSLTKVVDDALKLYAQQLLDEEKGEEMLIKIYETI